MIISNFNSKIGGAVKSKPNASHLLDRAESAEAEQLSLREQNISLKSQLDVMTAMAQALRDEMRKVDAKLATLKALPPVAYTDSDELQFQHATSDMWPKALGFGRDIPLFTACKLSDQPLNEIKMQSRVEGAFFTANHLLAAFEHGFIDKTANEVADVARMILESIKFMPNAEPDDFTSAYSDEVLCRMTANLRDKHHEE